MIDEQLIDEQSYFVVNFSYNLHHKVISRALLLARNATVAPSGGANIVLEK